MRKQGLGGLHYKISGQQSFVSEYQRDAELKNGGW